MKSDRITPSFRHKNHKNESPASVTSRPRCVKENMMELLGKSISCILCRGSIVYFDETGLDKFSRHLQFEHGTMHDFDFLLAACKMNQAEKLALVSVFNKKSTDESCDAAGEPSKAKVNVKNEKKSRSSVGKAKLGMFSNQKRKVAHFKTSKKRKSSILRKMVGNNIIDIKSYKASKVTCGKCNKTFSSRTKLFKHKAMKHLSLSVKSRKGKLRKKSEPLKKASYIAATTANRAAEALFQGSVVAPSGPQEQEASAKSGNRTQNDGGSSEVNEVILLDSKEEIKVEKTHLTKAGPSKELEPDGVTPNNTGSRNVSKESEGDLEAREAEKTGEESCRDCLELADSASKLSRHQRYVHGMKLDINTSRSRRDSKSDTPTKTAGSDPKQGPPVRTAESAKLDISVRTAKSDSNQSTPARTAKSDSNQDAPAALTDSTQSTPVRTAKSDSNQDTPATETDSTQSTPVRTAQIDSGQGTPATGTDSNQSTPVRTAGRDNKKDAAAPQEASTLPKPDFRFSNTISQPSDPRSPSSSKTKLPSTPPSTASTDSPMRSCLKSSISKKRLSVSFNQKVHFSDNTSVEHLNSGDEDDMEGIEEIISFEPVISPKRKFPEENSEGPVKKIKLTVTPPTESLKCEKCPEVFTTYEQVRSHACRFLRERRRTAEKKNYVENSVAKDSPVEIVLDEAVIVRVNDNNETGFEVRPPHQTNEVTVEPNTNTHPFESFLETVIVEVSDGGGVQRPVQGLVEKYKKGAKKVDFTKSNFFLKNAELLGGRSSGSSFKEVVDFLPPSWRVKTYNEWKKFYLTPEMIVLKSSCAVIEYVRLGYDLTQSDLRTLADCLAISSRVFNRYLDELFDDCVVID